MKKPLSQKTIERMYNDFELKEETINLLHDYFLSFSNLYGIISIRDAWAVFMNYEKLLIHKKDFINFSSVVMREKDLPYYIVDEIDLYCDGSDNPLDRLIINNEITNPYNRFSYVYKIEEQKVGKDYWLPETKEELMCYKQDQFYKSDTGKKMVDFLSKLKTDGIKKSKYNESYFEDIYDIEGNPIKGKYIKDIIFYTSSERVDLEYYKSEFRHKNFLKMYTKNGLEKALCEIKKFIQIYETSPNEITKLLEFFTNEMGAIFNENSVRKFIVLYYNLNNESHLWPNCGWTPNELSKKYSKSGPIGISMGPNIKKMFESGELDKEEIKKELQALGIDFIE